MLRYDSTAMPHPLVSRAAIVKAAEKAHVVYLYKPSLGGVFWILAQAAWLALALPFAAVASGLAAAESGADSGHCQGSAEKNRPGIRSCVCGLPPVFLP